MTTNRHMQSAEELGLARDERLLHTDRPGHVGNLTRPRNSFIESGTGLRRPLHEADGERLARSDDPPGQAQLTRDWLRYHARQQFVGDRYAYLHLWLTKSRVSRRDTCTQ
jgi:hypothetical protein